ncbi:hypothetical protein I3271_00875 [Photobacterium leiognathi]|uniref:hypothetical protein n=1 Tax=Photobacterium leiognathi TaxID=553611 RepID=UPI001EDCB8A3|nr:hypothetical protein [Photobacterium leiognathi]MCG3883235.1 hypothetical protein [Photobacterium leiognathi]
MHLFHRIHASNKQEISEWFSDFPEGESKDKLTKLFNEEIIVHSHDAEPHATPDNDDIDSILTALGANHSSDVNIMTWRSDFDIKPLLNLTKSTEIKSKHLIQYLCKRYNFKIEF